MASKWMLKNGIIHHRYTVTILEFLLSTWATTSASTKATNLAASHAAKRGLETANSSLDFAPLNIIAYKVSLFF